MFVSEHLTKQGDIAFVPEFGVYQVMCKNDEVLWFEIKDWLEAGNRARKERGEEEITCQS